MKMWHFSYANVANTRNVANKINKNIPEFGAKAVQTGHHTYFWTRWYDKTFTHLHICQFQFLKKHCTSKKQKTWAKPKLKFLFSTQWLRLLISPRMAKTTDRAERKSDRKKDRGLFREPEGEWPDVLSAACWERRRRMKWRKMMEKKRAKISFFSWVDAIELLPKNAKESTWF